MHLLVTRPEPDAGRLTAHLEALGYTVTRAPLMRIRPAETEPRLDGVQALAFTSANGVRAFATLSRLRGLPVFAVGEATAEAARACGFTDVAVAGGDVKCLAALIAARANSGGPVFHAAGRHVAGDLSDALGRAGIEVRRQALYEARAVDRLPAAAARALRGEPRALDGVLFFSPRTARLFEELAVAAGLREQLESVTAWCLSPAVAEALTPSLWRRSVVSRARDQTSLLAQLPPPDLHF